MGVFSPRGLRGESQSETSVCHKAAGPSLPCTHDSGGWLCEIRATLHVTDSDCCDEGVVI